MTQQVLFTPTISRTLAKAGPILKWAGGKGQLLADLRRRYPQGLESGQISSYAEPFIGGGAVYFDLIQRYPRVERAYIFDVNPELVMVYESIKREVEALIGELQSLVAEYLPLDEAGRKVRYYEVRDTYNSELNARSMARFGAAWIRRAAQTIFLNRTCFNGLFRVNSRGEFNVPAGRYKHPSMPSVERLRAAAVALQLAEIRLGDFSMITELADERTFIYYDPPYRPISTTSSFTSYMKGSFNDDDQRRLAAQFRALNERGVKQLLSNSDPTNHSEDPFFDNLYKGFYIERLQANRMINSKSERRGVIRELLIRNYEL